MLMRKMISCLLLLALLFSLAVPAVAADTAEIKGYAKKTGYTYVTFGNFANDASGNEAPILWRVLEVKGSEAFLLTEYIVDVHYVHLDTKAYYNLDWNESDLFAYLQNDFLPRAFDASEQAALLQRTEDGGLVTLPLIDDMRNVCHVVCYAHGIQRDLAVHRKMNICNGSLIGRHIILRQEAVGIGITGTALGEGRFHGHVRSFPPCTDKTRLDRILHMDLSAAVDRRKLVSLLPHLCCVHLTDGIQNHIHIVITHRCQCKPTACNGH